jgi:hypothetical protein
VVSSQGRLKGLHLPHLLNHPPPPLPLASFIADVDSVDVVPYDAIMPVSSFLISKFSLVIHHKKVAFSKQD